MLVLLASMWHHYLVGPGLNKYVNFKIFYTYLIYFFFTCLITLTLTLSASVNRLKIDFNFYILAYFVHLLTFLYTVILAFDLVMWMSRMFMAMPTCCVSEITAGTIFLSFFLSDKKRMQGNGEQVSNNRGNSERRFPLGSYLMVLLLGSLKGWAILGVTVRSCSDFVVWCGLDVVHRSTVQVRCSIFIVLLLRYIKLI